MSTVAVLLLALLQPAVGSPWPSPTLSLTATPTLSETVSKVQRPLHQGHAVALASSVRTAQLTPCQAAAQAAQQTRIVGNYVPQCNPMDGSYEPRQCHASTVQCWCVDAQGTEIGGTRQFQWLGMPACRPAPRPMTPCQAAAEAAQQRQQNQGRWVGVYVPQCEADGSYVPKQCYGSTGECWCVDPQGTEMAGTRRQPGAGNIICRPAPAPLTPCQAAAEAAERAAANQGRSTGMYVPQCNALDGSYTPKQCHQSSGYCWCVNMAGAEVPNTRHFPWQTNIICRPRVNTVGHRVLAAATQQTAWVANLMPQQPLGFTMAAIACGLLLTAVFGIVAMQRQSADCEPIGEDQAPVPMPLADGAELA